MYTATQTLVLSGPSDDQLNDDEDDPFTTANNEVLFNQLHNTHLGLGLP